jgi:hypothetical protein
MEKKDKALKEITFLEAEIGKVDDAIDTYNYDRRRIEATIKEVMHSMQYEQEK